MESSSQEIVNGRYRLVRCLGEGGMGSVYLSADLAEEQRPVALKRVHSTLLTPNGIDAFKAEFSAMTRLRHPNVVEVYDFGLDSATGEHFLTLEYVEGTDLRQAAAGLDRPAVLELLVQVCRGLEYIHSRGLVHNDLKPQNILVSSAAPRTCKLMDFGLASVEAAAGSGPAGLRGTLQYLAPELIRGAAADRRSDLYSLGVLFYLLLAGRLPFDGEPSEILARATSQAPEPLSRHAEGIEPPLEALVLRLLEKDPLARPDSAAGVIAAVAAASGLPFPVETPATIASAVRSGKFVGRQRELDRLVRHVDASLASGGEGAGRLILLSGESGVGKSRLVRQLRFEAQMRGVRVVTGQCYEGSASAFHPFVQIIRQILPDGLRGGELASLIPEAPAAGAAPAMDPEHAQRQVVGAAVQRLLETAEASPLMVCLEDLQWADTASIALLEHLARNVSSSARLVLVATYRSEESEGPPLSTALPRLLRAGNWERLELSRLREAELAEMLEGMFGLEEVPSELVELMLRETEGNPFYIQVALESLLEDQAHAATAGGRLLDFKGLAQLPFPRSLSEAIARRV
ncbi:MAG TPA: protein kinase, partial [Candidatus Polarisedimenticolia bacterium]|nr:protein kinase [Candidatus Polarisedimenticolia bacterium]